MDLVQALKNAVPLPLRERLSAWRRNSRRKLLAVDRVKDFSVLRRPEPYRRAFGIHRGTCIDRYYLEKFLTQQQASIRGRVLEVQSSAYAERFGGDRVQHVDVVDLDAANPKRTITADLAHCPEIASNTYDCVICTQTLLLIYDVRSAVAEIHRILKPGGVVLATMPGIAKICERELMGGAGEDYWRFTRASAGRMFSDVFGSGPVEVSSYGNVLSSIAFLHGLVAEELSAEELDAQDDEYQLMVAVTARKAREVPA